MNDNHLNDRSEARTALAPSPAAREARDLARPLPSSGWGYEDVESSSFDVQQLIGIFKRRRRIILATFALIMLLGVLATWLAKPVYQAQAKVLVDTANTSSSSGQFSAVDVMTGLSSARDLATQIEIFKSPAVVEAARKKLSPGALKSVREYSQIDVQKVGEANIMEVTVQSRNPYAASAYCNALVTAYMDEDEDTQHSGLRRASSFMRDRVKDVQQRRDKIARQLRDYKQKNNTVDLTAQTAAQITALSAAGAGRETAQTERAAAQAELGEVQRQASTLPPTVTTGNTIAPTAEVTAKKAELTNLELTLQQQRTEYTESSPEVTDTKARIARLNRDLARTTKTETTGSTIVTNPELTSARARIADLQGQIQAADARITSLQKNEARLRLSNRDLPAREYELADLTSQLGTLEQTYQLLNQEYEKLRINENATSASTRKLSTASVPRTPISPRVERNILTTMIAALVLAIALAALIDRMDDHVHSEEDAESASRLPIIAHVPFLTGGNSASLLSGGIKGSSALLESYRMLRTNIAFASIDEPIRSLAVTSSMPNEGKSTTALDLAVVMALDGKAVILLDADLRRPSLNSSLQVSNAIGFSSVVTGEKTIEEALQNTSTKNLRVMTSGPVPPNPPELLNSRVGRQIIEELAGMADFLIIDTPPALTMADAQIVASIADATILVISAQGANKKNVARTSDLLAQTGTKMLGVVLNKITSEWGTAYSYYGGYNVYYGTRAPSDLTISEDGDGASTNGKAPQLPKSSKK